MEKISKKLKIDEETIQNVIKTGTTTVGIIVKDAVVVGTESQATAGYTVATKNAQKLFQINNFTCATISGGVADCQYIVNQLKSYSMLKEVEDEKVPEPRSFYLAMMIVGGFSLKENKGELYGIDLLGTFYEEDKFMSFGSGSPFSLGVLEADWKANLTKAQGINLVKTAISSSKERDAASGHKIQICAIDKKGYTQVQ
ncbi:MAG: proteasome subunit beta [Promethearchaeota archaeon]